MRSYSRKAPAVALLNSIGAAQNPSQMSMEKPSIEPPSNLAAQKARSSAVIPWRAKTQRRRRAHDRPRKSARMILTAKRLHRFMRPPTSSVVPTVDRRLHEAGAQRIHQGEDPQWTRHQFQCLDETVQYASTGSLAVETSCSNRGSPRNGSKSG